MNNSPLIWRVLFAVGTALLAVLLLRVCTPRPLTGDERQTLVLLEKIVCVANDLEARHGRWPESLEQIIKTPDLQIKPSDMHQGKLVDSWGQPLQYIRPGPDHEGRVWSLGAEGKGDPRLDRRL